MGAKPDMAILPSGQEARLMPLWQRWIWTVLGVIIVSPLALLLIGMLMQPMDK